MNLEPQSTMELGLYTFAETTPDESGRGTTAPPRRMRELVEEAALAEQVGLDVFGVGEHHRPDFIVSSPKAFNSFSCS